MAGRWPETFRQQPRQSATLRVPTYHEAVAVVPPVAYSGRNRVASSTPVQLMISRLAPNYPAHVNWLASCKDTAVRSRFILTGKQLRSNMSAALHLLA